MMNVVYKYNTAKNEYYIYIINEEHTLKQFKKWENRFHWLNIKRENLQKEKVNIKEYIKKNYNIDVNIIKF